MSFEPDEVVVAGTGHIWVAPVGTTFPTNITAAVNDGNWIDLGYTTPDGVHPTFDRQSKDILVWQSREAVRTIITAVPKKFDFVLVQQNQNTWALACGGGTWSGSDPNYSYAPPDPAFVDERAGIIEWSDGDDDYRILIPKWLNKAPLDFMLRADDSQNLPISMSVLAADAGGASWTFQTNDPNLGLAAAAGS